MSSSLSMASKTAVPKLGTMGTPVINLMQGKAEMVHVGGAVSDVLVANPDVVDVMAVQSNKLYLVGSQVGDTNIMALDAQGNVLKKINVHVQMDTDKLSDMISELYPNEKVSLSALRNQLVLTGEVANPAMANKIVNLAGRYIGNSQGGSATNLDDLIVNMMTVRGEQQVMLRVKIVEASRSALKDLGLELNSAGGANVGDVGGALATAPQLGLSGATQLGVAALNYSSGNFGNLSFLARALEQEGIVNTLAEPNLTAISGEQAGFLAGGEFPIPTNLDRNGNTVYEFRPFGVSLNFKPIVMSKDRISLQMTTEVSTASFDQALQLNGVSVPTFNVRRAETTVELPSGGTLMIAGLIQSNTISGLSQLPGIGDVPVVGDLIKSDTFKRNESEVIVMITPYLVEPFKQNRAAPAPRQASLSSPQPALLPQEKAQGIDNVSSMNNSYMEQSSDNQPSNQLPSPREAVRQKNHMKDIFSSNIQRVYGTNIPHELKKNSGNFVYVTD